MNAKQLAALTERERVQVTHISTRTRPNTLVEMVQDFATALADARLEVAALQELADDRDNARNMYEDCYEATNNQAAKILCLEAEVARLVEALGLELGDCPNCRGQHCMACVVREVHDICADDCPNCRPL